MKNGTAAALALLASCSEKIDSVAAFPLEQCRRVALIDAATGAGVVGAEDMSIDAAKRRLIISAYDRRAVERQAARREARLDEGGVYAVPFDALAGEAASLTVESIVSRESVAGGLRPHGVAFDEARREITFVNRSYQKIDGRWRMTPRIERAGADGAVFVGEGGAARCSANDIAVLGDRAFVSFDHAVCGWRGGLENLFAARVSGVEAADGRAVFAKARHANGVAATPDRRLALAATRDKSIILLDEKSDGFDAAREIGLPGAPDNLTVAEDGALVAAVYPSLAAIGAQRIFGIGRSASRIVSADVETGTVRVLYDDPAGKMISAASVGVLADGVLAIGSALDRGIVVCKKKATDS